MIDQYDNLLAQIAHPFGFELRWRQSALRKHFKEKVLLPLFPGANNGECKIHTQRESKSKSNEEENADPP